MNEEILNFLLLQTQKKHSSTVNEISEAIHMSRNLTAKAVHELYDQGRIISIDGEKRCYYHKELLEEMYHQTLSQTQFKCDRSLWDALGNEERRDFEKLIGFDDSLATCVEMCKAAISYPQNSLPVLLNGPTGTGKSFMAQLMYEYACGCGIIAEDAPFITLNCSEYANNPELLSAHLFGHKKGAFTGADRDNPGLIQAAHGGILFLDEVHCLKAECQEKLFLFMDKGEFHRIGENEKWETSHVRLIFATTESPEKVLLKTFLRRIPVLVYIPALSERGIYERIQLLYTIFSQEEKRIQRPISISNLVYNAFLSYHFTGNIGELKNTIQVCCAHALHTSNEESLQIHLEDLPDKMFDQTKQTGSNLCESDERMIRINDLRNQGNKESPLLLLYESFATECNVLDDYLNSLQVYYDKVNFDTQNATSNKHEFIFENLEGIVRKTFQKYGGKINNNDLLSLFHMFEDIRRQPMNVKKFQLESKEMLHKLHTFIKSALPKEKLMSNEIMQLLYRQTDLRFESFDIDVLALIIRLFNRNTDLHKRIGIILAHGYSTASSIADAANKLLDDYIFESIDMAIDDDSSKIVEELNTYLHNNNNFEELVLLVDMGSLEQIYTGIDQNIHANIGIVNNITTKLALEVGNGLRNNVPLHELLQVVCEGNEFRFHIIEKRQKEDIIVCACASGLGTAEKLRKLLISSFPSDIKIHVVTHDYHLLMAQKEHSELFEKNNVLCVIGTLDPVIDNVAFIPIEELIVEQDIEKLGHILREYMNKDEVEKFKQDILKNFSLTNVMNYLTILNPTMLLEHVASALDHLQKIYGIHLHNTTCVGLYVHICCMIERLVMRQPLDNYVDIDHLKKMEHKFIQCVKKSFEDTEKYYGIEIPEHEIGYIYDYIQNGANMNDEW
ncbi:MAG: sigma 54-interacting transcriptional regulator [Longicatena sp.]